MKIKIEKLEKINEGILYLYFRATNLSSQESKETKSVAYYGDDIFINSILTEEQIKKIPVINGKRYGNEILVSEEIREYSEENGDKELKKEGWEDNIHNAIAYVMY